MPVATVEALSAAGRFTPTGAVDVPTPSGPTATLDHPATISTVLKAPGQLAEPAQAPEGDADAAKAASTKSPPETESAHTEVLASEVSAADGGKNAAGEKDTNAAPAQTGAAPGEAPSGKLASHDLAADTKTVREHAGATPEALGKEATPLPTKPTTSELPASSPVQVVQNKPQAPPAEAASPTRPPDTSARGGQRGSVEGLAEAQRATHGYAAAVRREGTGVSADSRDATDGGAPDAGAGTDRSVASAHPPVRPDGVAVVEQPPQIDPTAAGRNEPAPQAAPQRAPELP